MTNICVKDYNLRVSDISREMWVSERAMSDKRQMDSGIESAKESKDIFHKHLTK